MIFKPKAEDGYCDEPVIGEFSVYKRRDADRYKPKIRGHIPGGSPTVPRGDYAGIVLLSELFSWTRYDIGKLWGIKPISVRTIIRRWKSD